MSVLSQAREHTVHVTVEELLRLSEIDLDTMQDEEYQWLSELDDKLEHCAACREIQKRFDNVTALLPNAFSSLLPQEETVTSPVAESLREVFAKLSETRDDIIDRSRLWARNSAIRRALASRDTKGPSKPDAEIAIAAAVSDGHFDLELPFDAELREKIATWLEGAQNLLGGAFGHQARFGVSALAGASRDATGPSEPDAEIAIAVTATDDGYFDFELSAETVLQLIVKRQTADGEPVCAMVFGRSGTEFFQVCALSRLGTKNLRTPEIVLPAGAYTLCVPVAAAEQNGE